LTVRKSRHAAPALLERLVAGRERIYFDRIWNDFTGDPGKPDEATRNFFTATYAQPGGMRAGNPPAHPVLRSGRFWLVWPTGYCGSVQGTINADMTSR
jgi:hypothetical protein